MGKVQTNNFEKAHEGCDCVDCHDFAKAIDILNGRNCNFEGFEEEPNLCAFSECRTRGVCCVSHVLGSDSTIFRRFGLRSLG